MGPAKLTVPVCLENEALVLLHCMGLIYACRHISCYALPQFGLSALCLCAYSNHACLCAGNKRPLLMSKTRLEAYHELYDSPKISEVQGAAFREYLRVRVLALFGIY